jgi:hypothetical protein
VNTEPISVRIVRRHHAAVLLRSVPTTKTRVEYTDGGVISAAELASMLEPQIGFVVRLRFHPASDGPPPTIALEAVTENGEVATGKLVLHAAIAEDEIVTWAELTLDQP